MSRYQALYGYRLPTQSADAAFFSTWASIRVAVQVTANQFNRPVTNLPGEAEAEQARVSLSQRGVDVALDGLVCFTQTAAASFWSNPWVMDLSKEDKEELVGPR